jgi:hypothetical protein
MSGRNDGMGSPSDGEGVMQTQTWECAICGRNRNIEDGWFLLTESRWQDKVTILQWHDRIATQTGVQRVCGASHAQELVVQWMITGSLDYPFARIQELPDERKRARRLLNQSVDTRGAQQIGELAIHRESIQRILSESPHSLTTILDALLNALERNQASADAPLEADLDRLCEVGAGAH